MAFDRKMFTSKIIKLLKHNKIVFLPHSLYWGPAYRPDKEKLHLFYRKQIMDNKKSIRNVSSYLETVPLFHGGATAHLTTSQAAVNMADTVLCIGLPQALFYVKVCDN
jgi:hypothetical protein